MWTTGPLGVGSWKVGDQTWLFDARGGTHGIGVVDMSGGSENDALDDVERPAEMAVRFSAVDQDCLPSVAEQFVRGDQWHLTYPQADGVYQLQLVLRPVESLTGRIVLETTIAIQTDLLDTHPKIDLEVPCDSFVGHPLPFASDQPSPTPGAAPIHLAVTTHSSVAVLLGPQDSPFTTDVSEEQLLRLRLFGEFLEKGVIRKARPWLVISRQTPPPEDADLHRWWRQLCDSPPPLTA